ncbi:MAG: PQQ-dependent sugar dehydrogenase [Deltaproteobacteria bacterium]|nr:PQQ-dependent sugar dehydrogenase [Deltaproteobacteria bacterium]
MIARRSVYAACTLLPFLAGAPGLAAHAAPLPREALREAVPKLRFERPVALVQAPGDPGRWFVVEKAGRVRWFESDPAAGRASLVADISSRVESGPSEAGLLGMAFHPRFAQNGYVFLSYTAPGDGNPPLVSRISRFTSPDGGNALYPASEVVILSIDQPYTNHNGGGIGFGPDGYLYAGYGDGGSGGDPHRNGQNPRTLLGKMLRIDVDRGSPYAIPPDNPYARGGGRPEIFALGLRNPWRWSFDRETRELWVADVGQHQWEEVDRVERGGNYGWNIREGAHCFRAKRCKTAGLIDPVAEYSHKDGFSITGGYVYRGKANPELRGFYVYADYGSGKVWGFPVSEQTPKPRLLLETDLRPSSFAEDSSGELYLLDYAGGRVYRFVKAE